MRLIWLWRLAVLAFAVAYLTSGTLQLWVSPWPPFLAAAAVELQFFLSGVRATGGVRDHDPGPQPRDLEDFGWDSDPAPARRPRKARRRLVQAAVVLALLAGLFLLDRSRPSWQKLPAHAKAVTIARLEREAARIAGHPATVTCDVGGRHVGYVQEADGIAEVGGHRMWLTPGICYRLAKLPRISGSTEIAAGHAIAVFAHEAWHLRGERSEALANCYGYQSGVQVGRAFGLSQSTARRLMYEQLANNAADFADAPAYVVPHGCHRGGAFDLKLDGAHFP